MRVSKNIVSSPKSRLADEIHFYPAELVVRGESVTAEAKLISCREALWWPREVVKFSSHLSQISEKIKWVKKPVSRWKDGMLT